MNDEDPSEQRFHRAMESIYEDALRLCDYRASRFLQMVQTSGGLATAKRLLATDEFSEGLTRLWECRRLDLTVEALVLQPAWRSLFTEDEQRRARSRLAELDYQFPEEG